MKNLTFFISFILNSVTVFSQLVISNQGGTASAIVNSMIGSGITISNATITCPSVAYGTFTNGSSTNIGISSGIVLSTGNISTLNGLGSAFWSVNNPGGGCNDPQLGSLEPAADYDCCILEFDVVPSCTTLIIRFVFGSEEYPEFVSAGYNDAFGFFITGPNPSGGSYNNTNVATLPNNTTIVSIDNVNAGTNSAYYVDNSTGTSIVLDAFTTVLTRNIVVTPCQSYHFKLAVIADAGDNIYDSGVFIDFLDCVNAIAATTSTSPATCAGNNGSATATASAGYPPYTYSWNTTPPQTTATATGLAPGTYTVSVDDAGACTPPLVQTVTITNSSNTITPTFTQIAPICSGGSISLPSTSNNNIVGSWSPAINNTATTTYTFTPNPGQCASTQTMTVAVNQPVIPNFNQISAICSGGTFTLPLTSTNSISGTWSPSINNTATTTYTFLPNSGQCATNQTMTVTVNQPTPPNFNQISPICLGGNFTLPNSSTNGITGSWSPAVNNTATTTYTFLPNSGQCATNQMMTVQVNQPSNPTFDQIAPICSGGNFVLPSSSLNGISGTWSPSLNYTSTTLYTFVPNSDQCANQTTMTVNVVNPITPSFNQWGPYCQNDILIQVILPETSNEGIAGTWNPAMVSTAVAGNIVHTFTPNTGQCANSASMIVLVNAQVQTTFNQIEPICIGDNLTFSSTSIEGIQGTWNPNPNNTTTTNYYFTHNPSQCATDTTMTVIVNSPIVPSFENVGPYCEGETFSLNANSLEGITGVWSPPIDNQQTTNYTFTPNSGECAVSTSLEIIINSIPSILINESPSICVGQNTNLTTTVSNLGGTYTWQPGGESTNQITVSPSTTTNYSVNYTLNGCTSNATTTVIVNPNVPVDAGSNVSVCAGVQVTLVASGTPNNTWSGGITDGVAFTPNQSGYYFVVGTSDNGCVTNDSVLVTVNTNPIISAGNPQTVCVGDQIILQGTGAGVGGTYTWSNGVIDGQAFNLTGTTNFTVTGTDVNGCTGTSSVLVTGLLVPIAQFTATPTEGEIPLNVVFTNNSQNAITYSWDFGNGQGNVVQNLSNQQTTYSEFGNYTVWLIASNGLCADSMSVQIKATANPWIFVPNVFSPNEDDANEFWMIQTKNMSSIDLIILNRWGNLMAKVEDLGGGWDGKTPNGNQASDGTYFYKYKATAINGEEFSGHGFFTLIR